MEAWVQIVRKVDPLILAWFGIVSGVHVPSRWPLIYIHPEDYTPLPENAYVPLWNFDKRAEGLASSPLPPRQRSI